MYYSVGYGGPYLQTQQTILETQHNIFETQHKIIETRHDIIQTQHKLSKHNTILSKHNTKLSKQNTILSKHNTILSKHNIKLPKHNTKLSKHNTKITETQSSMQNWYAIIQRTILSLVNRWQVMRQTKSPRNIDVFVIKCLVCSEELEETYKFCSRCGAAIDKEEVPYVIIFSVASLTRLFYSFWKSTMQWKYTLCLDTRQPGSVLKHTTYPAVWNYSRIFTEKLIQSFWKLEIFI